MHSNGDYRTTFNESYPVHGRVEVREPSRRYVASAVPTGDPEKMLEFDTTTSLAFREPVVTDAVQRVGGDELNKLRAHHFTLGESEKGAWKTTMKESYDAKAEYKPAKAFAPKLQGSSIPQGDPEKISEWQTTTRSMCAATGAPSV